MIRAARALSVHWAHWAGRLAAACAVGAIIGFLVIHIVRYAVDVPVWDQWELVPLLAQAERGSLTLADVWVQHNEHRLLVPQLIMLALARFTGWSIPAELTFNVVLAVSLFGVLAWQLAQAQIALGDQAALLWLWPALALWLFSLQAYENWLWGWQIQIFLNVLAAASGLSLLTRPVFRWRNFALAVLCGATATFSFATGLFFWPVGAALLGWAPQARRVVWVWLGVWILVLVVFFSDYRVRGQGGSLLAALSQPGDYLLYVAKYLGAPVAAHRPAWPAWAGISLLGVTPILVLAWRQTSAEVKMALAPFAALALYALGSAALSGVGRIGFGSDQALSSRYVTLSTFFSLAAFIGLHALARHTRLAAGWRFAAAVLALALVASTAWTSWRARISFADRYNYLDPARTALIAQYGGPAASADQAALDRLYPDPGILRQRAAQLAALRLSVFRDDAP